MAGFVELIDNRLILKHERSIDNFFFLMDQDLAHIYRGINQKYDDFMIVWRRIFFQRTIFNERWKIINDIAITGSHLKIYEKDKECLPTM